MEGALDWLRGTFVPGTPPYNTVEAFTACGTMVCANSECVENLDRMRFANSWIDLGGISCSRGFRGLAPHTGKIEDLQLTIRS